MLPSQKLLVGEAVCALAGAALPLQEQGHGVPRRVSDAVAPRGLCDPQQLTHTGRDDLQEAQRRGVFHQADFTQAIQLKRSIRRHQNEEEKQHSSSKDALFFPPFSAERMCY